MLNKQRGNMYGFVTHTWNPIKGKCSHDCNYCYMKRWGELNPLKLDEKDLNTNLGTDNFIFVGSSTDMFAKDVPERWIKRVMSQCMNYEGNTYLFQTKNPDRFNMFNYFDNFILCITLETNRNTDEVSQAPSPVDRVKSFGEAVIHKHKVITIEPIMDFDLEEFVDMIKSVKPEWVAIGADTGRNNLREPSWTKIRLLIAALEKFTMVRIKDNLSRLNK